MAKNVVNLVKDIEARAKTLKRFMGNVYLSDVDDADGIHADRQGSIEPYLMVFTPGVDEGPYSSQGIVSSREDSKTVTVIFQVVGTAYLQVQELAQDVRELFEGYEPPNTSQMRERTAVTTGVPGSATMRPRRRSIVLIFHCILD